MELHIPSICPYWSICHQVLTILLLIDFSLPNTVANSFQNETDRLALIEFKKSVVTDPHGILNTWNESYHFCSWQGITCGSRHQRVIYMNLQDYGLQGTISPYIGNLSFLRFMDLENNSFSGKIPQQVDHLFRLQHLFLRNNMLEGTIPVNITFCPELSIISLGSNRLTGKISTELGSLGKLLVLDLEQNNLTGVIPSSIGNLSSIRQLVLGFNNLVSKVPEEIGQLKTLSLLTLGPNNLSGMIPPNLFNISSMTTLSITDNNFKGIIPPAIGLNMPNLRQFYVGGNEFSGQIPESFSNASQLQGLDFYENNFVGQVPTSFGNLPQLLYLSLGKNSLGNYSANDLGFIKSLTNCSKLETLNLRSNNFGGVLPSSVANLSSKLTVLYVGNNQISGTIPGELENLINLIALGLNKNQFTGVIPASFGKFQQLQVLGLHNNRLSGGIPSSIGNLSQLYQLYMLGNELEGSIPSSIGDCQHLQEMEISQNSLTGEIPPQVIGLSSSSLLLLNLSQNSLTGSLPVEVGKLKSIHTLDISNNNLTGEIPEVIGGCQGLEFLYLQGNLFQGIIPFTLASLKGLQYLDLSRNNLSGQIPNDLQRLPFLLYLNLSFNNLEGEVPNEGIFRNTSTLSLVGNTKLCGGVSDLKLPACPIKLQEKRNNHGFKLKFTIALVAGCSLLLLFFCSLYWRRKFKKKQLPAVSSIELLPKVSYKKLYEATRGFSPSALIGSGGFGCVYKGMIDQEEGNIIAIKVLNLQRKGASKSFIAECNALRNIRHRNLVKILTCCSSMDYSGNEFKALVFEYMSNGSLEEWLHTQNQSRSLNLYQRLNIAIDAASALCYLHDHCEQPIIHRDLKPSNVLLDNDMIAHISDFGIARLISITEDAAQNQSSTIGIKGTIGYAAPEYAIGADASTQGDVYSYGILVLEMFTGRRPTDEMFKDGLNLHNFVKMAIPGRLVQIVDPSLLATVEETAPAATTDEVNYMESGHSIEIEAEQETIDHGNISSHVWKCIYAILNIGVACSEESPKSRMFMEDIVRDLQHLKNAFNAVEISRERRPRRS